MADLGEGPGEAGGPGPPLFLDQIEARKAEKIFWKSGSGTVMVGKFGFFSTGLWQV